MIDLSKLPFTFDKMIDFINTGRQFHLSRWGDGEFMCVLGYGGSNTDKHHYFQDMAEKLEWILNTGGRGEMFALQSLALKDLAHHPEFEAMVMNNTWFANAEILARNHARDQEFFDAVNTRNVVLVGNEYLRAVPFKYRDFIEIPLFDCWLEHDRILKELQHTIQSGDLVLYCASMMANVLIDELFHLKYSQLDVGSFLDPYVGRMTRRYHHGLNIQ